MRTESEYSSKKTHDRTLACDQTRNAASQKWIFSKITTTPDGTLQPHQAEALNDCKENSCQCVILAAPISFHVREHRTSLSSFLQALS